ncbi:MAG: serine hydrolase [Bacteroidota bacterium]|nr:serine hydrolase [Bacteroidota bacterium]
MDKHWDKTRVAGNDDILEYLNKYAPPKLFEPGSKYEHSNTGYVLLASIAKQASEKEFIKMCRKWIFKPLKMHSTNIRTLKEKRRTENFFIGHIYEPERQHYVRANSFPSLDYHNLAGQQEGPGRVSSTAADLLKWDQALYTKKLVTNRLCRNLLHLINYQMIH